MNDRAWTPRQLKPDSVRDRSVMPPHFHIPVIALDSRRSGRDFARMKSVIAMPLGVNWQN